MIAFIGQDQIFCSAVWISDRHLLTAGHCVFYKGKVSKGPLRVLNTKNTDYSVNKKQYQILERFPVVKVGSLILKIHPKLRFFETQSA